MFAYTVFVLWNALRTKVFFLDIKIVRQNQANFANAASFFLDL